MSDAGHAVPNGIASAIAGGAQDQESLVFVIENAVNIAGIVFILCIYPNAH